MPMPSVPVRPMTAARQLTMVFDTVTLRSMMPGERAAAVTQLAVLLMEAAGAAMEERDDGER